MSRIAMNMPRTISRKAMRRLGSMLSLATAAGARGTAGRLPAVSAGAAAFAIGLLHGCEGGAAGDWRLGVDADHHRKARPQGANGALVNRQRNPHRHALDDLREVA